MKKTVYLEDTGDNGVKNALRYEVTKLVNTLVHRVGMFLRETEVQELMRNGRYEVVITKGKK